MERNPDHLPQLADELFVTDGGLETTLVFHQGIDLPHFAAFGLLEDEQGRQTLREYYRQYTSIAERYGLGFVIETVTWRANPDWGRRLGYSAAGLADVNRSAVKFAEELRQSCGADARRMPISGCIGPRGDGYVPDSAMTAEAAESYHREQIETFAETDCDFVSAMTINYVDEAIGVARAAKSLGLPSVISFTVETDGCLPTGQSLKDAIECVDRESDAAPAYFKINCAHPTHFASALATDDAWVQRLRGVRANASTRSHAELDEAEELDEGNPVELGRQYRELRKSLPQLTVLGGCCGTDHRHVEEICKACTEPA